MINATRVSMLANAWQMPSLAAFAETLQSNTDSSNAGGVVGNRMFYANDYMVRKLSPLQYNRQRYIQVHRGRNYVSTLKMYSSRTLNTECVNAQNVSCTCQPF